MDQLKLQSVPNSNGMKVEAMFGIAFPVPKYQYLVI
jgi:hypothetical protein